MERSSTSNDPAPRADDDGARAGRFPLPTGSRTVPRAHRPREKLWARGPTELSACELVAVVLGSGVPGRSAAAIAAGLVRRHGLAGLAGLDAEGWRRERGLGPASAARLSSAWSWSKNGFFRAVASVMSG